MHVLVNVDMSEPRIRSMLTKWKYGYVFDKMEICVLGAAQYVSGYLTKKWPGVIANHYRQVTKTRVVQASQSLGAIFSQKSTWSLVNLQIRVEEVNGYVWDVYEARFLTHKNGASLMREKECFTIASHPVKADIEAFRQLTKETSPLSIESVESQGLKLIGIQQTLILER